MEPSNLLKTMKEVINEDIIDIEESNKQLILKQIKNYLDFLKSHCKNPNKIQDYEEIKKDYLLFLYFINNVEKQSEFIIKYFDLKFNEEEKQEFINYLLYFYNISKVIFLQ